MNAAPQPGAVIQLRSATWKVLGTSGLKRGFRKIHCRGLSGLVHETLDAIKEDPATDAFERMVNAHPTRLHKKVINDPVTKKMVIAKRVTFDQIKKRMAFPASIERPPTDAVRDGERPSRAADGGGFPRNRQNPANGTLVVHGVGGGSGWCLQGRIHIQYNNPRPRLDYPF